MQMNFVKAEIAPSKRALQRPSRQPEPAIDASFGALRHESTAIDFSAVLSEQLRALCRPRTPAAAPRQPQNSRRPTPQANTTKK